MKLLKTYLKPFAALVLACILLLFGQAMCDLTLPNLMSDIVNTGIQLGGVDEAAPAVLNQQAVDLLTLFMNDAEAGTFKNAYTPVEHGSDEEAKLAKTYENIKDMDAVALSEDADVQAVGDAYGKAAYAFMTFLKDYGAQTGQAVDTESGVQDMDMRQLYAVIPMLQQMPKETFSEAINSAENAQSMIGSQVGATFTKLFYKELGVDLDAKQVHYIVIRALRCSALRCSACWQRCSSASSRRVFRPAWQSRCAAMSSARWKAFPTRSSINFPPHHSSRARRTT